MEWGGSWLKGNKDPTWTRMSCIREFSATPRLMKPGRQKAKLGIESARFQDPIRYKYHHLDCDWESTGCSRHQQLPLRWHSAGPVVAWSIVDWVHPLENSLFGFPMALTDQLVGQQWCCWWDCPSDVILDGLVGYIVLTAQCPPLEIHDLVDLQNLTSSVLDLSSLGQDSCRLFTTTSCSTWWLMLKSQAGFNCFWSCQLNCTCGARDHSW